MALTDPEPRPRPSPEGVFAAALTPLDARLAPDIAAAADHARRLLAAGCDGIALLGTTGEAMSLSLAQRRALLDGVLAAGLKPERLIVGTGAAALADSIALSRHATDAGVGGCLVAPPFYFKGVSDAGLFASYAALIEGVGEDGLRLFLYHFPQMTAVPIPGDVIARLCEAFPGIVAGVKDSSGDLDNMTRLARAFPHLAVFSGTERYHLAMREAGGAGSISAGANVSAREIATLEAAWQKEGGAKGARGQQERVSALRALFEGTPMIAAMKALIARDRAMPGWARVVPPLVPLAGAALNDMLARWDGEGCRLP